MTNEYCIFCKKFSSKNNLQVTREWYDEPLFKNDKFVAVPALGQLVPGYLQVITRKHILSMSQLNPDETQQLLDFCKDVISFLSHYWGDVVIFEHGVCKDDKPSGACINHAHWHIVPGDYDILPQGKDFQCIDSFDVYIKAKNLHTPYLYYRDQNQREFILENPKVPSQFFRRILASKIGKLDEWDYLVFPFYENIKKTYACMDDFKSKL